MAQFWQLLYTLRLGLGRIFYLRVIYMQEHGQNADPDNLVTLVLDEVHEAQAKSNGSAMANGDVGVIVGISNSVFQHYQVLTNGSHSLSNTFHPVGPILQTSHC